MDAYKIIKDDIQRFVRTWLKTGLICNPQISDKSFLTSRSIKSQISNIKSESEYIKDFASNYENGMYLLAIEDGSVFQVAYEFNGSRRNIYLVKASISYLPSIQGGRLLHSYVRLDYDSNMKNNFFHPISHLHIGFDNDLRMPTDDIPLFSEFFKFIMYLYYHDKFLTIINKSEISDTYSKDEGRLTPFVPLSIELRNFVHLKLSNIGNI